MRSPSSPCGSMASQPRSPKSSTFSWCRSPWSGHTSRGAARSWRATLAAGASAACSAANRKSGWNHSCSGWRSGGGPDRGACRRAAVSQRILQASSSWPDHAICARSPAPDARSMSRAPAAEAKTRAAPCPSHQVNRRKTGRHTHEMPASNSFCIRRRSVPSGSTKAAIVPPHSCSSGAWMRG